MYNLRLSMPTLGAVFVRVPSTRARGENTSDNLSLLSYSYTKGISTPAYRLGPRPLLPQDMLAPTFDSGLNALFSFCAANPNEISTIFQCLTLKVSHEYGWRESWLCRIRDRHTRWL